MTHGLEELAKMDYPGRFIIIGRDCANKNSIIVFGITEKNKKNKLREIVEGEYGLFVDAKPDSNLSDEEKKDLRYEAVAWECLSKSIAVSNGPYTPGLLTIYRKFCPAPKTPSSNLDIYMSEHEYENDPSSTPRIAGIILNGKAALGIIKKGINNVCERQYFEVPLIAGHGKLIATYAGSANDPLQPYNGEPKKVLLEGNSPIQIIDDVYDLKVLQEKFRVAVAAVFIDDKFNIDFAVRNRHGRIFYEGSVKNENK